MRRGEDSLDLAITRAEHQRLGRLAGRETVGWRVGRQHRRQLVGIDRDEIRRVLGEIRVNREHRSDGLADIAEPLLCQQWLVVGPQCLGCRIAKSIGGRSARSAPVQTATTPGAGRPARN